MALWILLAALASPQEAEEPHVIPPPAARGTEFRRDIFPILKERCFKCHSGPGPKGGFRLDFHPEVLGETTGIPLVVPGRGADSLLIRVVTAPRGRKPEMPSKAAPLSAEDVGLLRAWIDQGAKWDESLLPSTVSSNHWAFRPVRPPAGGSIDAFIGAGLKARGLTPSPEADRRTLIRRLSLDLTGLPPSVEEVGAFVEDASPGAFERLVERLLSSPHYGERWARHWLDVARYAESEGYESNHARPSMWRYRDYVVRSFNEDKPFDRFLREQIAGDEIEPYSDSHLIATAFLGGARLSSNEEDKPLQRNDVLVDIVNATSQAFLGLTMNCAQCHNHKFDPISQRDYYRFMGFFVKGMPNNLALRDRAEYDARRPAEYDTLQSLRRIFFERGRQRFIENAKKRMSPETLRALEVPEEKRTPKEYDLAREADLRFQVTAGGYERFVPAEDLPLYNEVKKKIESLRKTMPEEPHIWGFYSPGTSPHRVDVMEMKAFYPLPYDPESLGRATAYLPIRGDVHRRGPRLAPGWPAVLAPTPASLGDRPRSALADWLASRENPLVARVWVNRLWHWHFGHGIVATPGDFGTKGAPPTHPELLDWLAAQLIEGGWSTKRIHRLIVTSAAYRQAARIDPKNAALDPENRYLWRWEPRRLEAEALRDAALAASGELDRRVGGPPITADEKRRSIYLPVKRDEPSSLQAMFDAPAANESCSMRHVTTVALQPLFLLNNPFMTARAKSLADRVRGESAAETAFEIVLSRVPDEAERAAAAAYLSGGEGRLTLFCQALLNLNEFAYLE